MQKRFCLSLLALLAGVAFLGGAMVLPAQSQMEKSLSQTPAVQCPTLTLKHWKSSSQEEKLAFLFGFATLLEIEREWQDKKPLPVSRSLNGIWARGLSNVSLGDIVRGVDGYIAEHPDELDMPVLRVVSSLFVSPKMSQPERDQARTRWEEIKRNR